MSNPERNLKSVPASVERAQPVPEDALAVTGQGKSGRTAAKIIAATAALIGALAGGKAEAQEQKLPCIASLQGANQPSATVKPNEPVRWAMTTRDKGDLKLPKGPVGGGLWINDGFERGKCLVGDRNKCGEWSAHKVYDQPGTYTETITVEDAQCDGASRLFTVNVVAPEEPAPQVVPAPVDPNEAKWTIDEKDDVMEHLKNDPDGGRWFDLGAGVYVVPNLDTTTSVKIGPYVDFNARPGTKYATVGAELQWARTGQPIWSGLRPQNTMDTQQDSYTALFTGGAALPIDAGVGYDWLEFYLRGAAGITVLHHGQEDIGDGRVVSADTRVMPVIGASAGAALCPHKNFCFTAGGRGQLELNTRPTDAGTEGQADAPKDVIHGEGGGEFGVETKF